MNQIEIGHDKKFFKEKRKFKNKLAKMDEPSPALLNSKPIT